MGEDVFVGQVPSGLGEGQDPAPEGFELSDGEMSPECFSRHFAAGTPRPLRHRSKAVLKLRIETDGEGGSLQPGFTFAKVYIAHMNGNTGSEAENGNDVPDYRKLIRVPELDEADSWTWSWPGPEHDLT